MDKIVEKKLKVLLLVLVPIFLITSLLITSLNLNFLVQNKFTPKNIEPEKIDLPKDPIQGRLTINFKPEMPEEEKKTYLESIGAKVVGEIKELNSVTIEVDENKVEEVKSSDKIAKSEPDYYVSILEDPTPSPSSYPSTSTPPTTQFTVNDPRFSEQWGLEVIGAKDGWIATKGNTEEIKVAVIDSGVCSNHPDLQGKILPGYDFVENDDTPQDELGHGCAVIGVIAANLNNKVGIAGIATNARIIPLRVLDAQGLGSYSNVASAIVYAVNNGAKIINLSLGGANASSILENAINYARDNNVVVVAAAGNTGRDGVLYPAAYDYVIAVGSVDSNLQRSSFSTTGPQLDIYAPGRDILSINKNGEYSYVSGTSFAAPLVSAIVALKSTFDEVIHQDRNIISFLNENHELKSSTNEPINNELSNSNSSNNTVTAFASQDARALKCGNAPFIWPTWGKSGYVWRSPTTYTTADGEQKHDGVDILQTNNTDGTEPVYAVADGYLHSSDRQIWLDVDINTSAYPGTRSHVVVYYTHLQSYDGTTSYIDPQFRNVSETSKKFVTQGTYLGKQGSYDPGQPKLTHLHISVNSAKGEANNIDPSPYFGLNLNYDTGARPMWALPSFNCGVTLYEKPNYQGASYTLTSDNLDLCHIPLDQSLGYQQTCFQVPSWTDAASSIKVAPGWHADLHIHNIADADQWHDDSTQSYKCNEDIPDFRNKTFPNGTLLNDNLSRIYVSKCDPSAQGLGALSCGDPVTTTPNLCIGKSNGNYCGTTLGLDQNTLYKCSNGASSFIQSCTYGCSIQAQGTNDFCLAPPTSNQCPNNQNGTYCGGELGSNYNANALYSCQNGVSTQTNTCTYGCIIKPPGTADVCRSTPTSTAGCPSGGNGNYCGTTLGLNPNKLYNCNSGTITEVASCSNGCELKPPGTADACYAPGSGGSPILSGSVKLFGDQNYNNLRLEIKTLKTEEPSRGTPYKSLEMPGGWSVVLHDHSLTEVGHTECFNQSIANLETVGGWSTSIESMEIFQNNVCPTPSTASYVKICRTTGWWEDHQNDCITVDKDIKNLGDMGFGDNVVKSIWFAGNWEASLFEHGDYQGAKRTLSDNSNDLGGFTPLPFGYGTSSIKVHRKEPTRFILYDLGDRNGTPFKSDRPIDNLDHWRRVNEQSWNDSAKSIYLDPGFEAIVFNDAGYHGQFSRISQSMNFIPNMPDNSVSSVQICEGTCPAGATKPTPNLPTEGQTFLPETPISLNWIGDGKEYTIEYWGGDLPDHRFDSTTNSQSTFVKNGLNRSANPYFWHVKGWNPYGESIWSDTFSFKIQDVPPAEVVVDAPNIAEIGTDVTVKAYTSPSAATNLTYNWSPQPKSGQGTDTATYIVNKPGDMQISLTVSNTGGSLTSSDTIAAGCPTGKYLAEYFTNKTLSGEPIAYSCETEINNNWTDQGPSQISFFGSGKDGDLTINSGQVIKTDDSRSSIAQNTTTGATTINVATNVFNITDKILIIQSRGNGAGTYEINEINAMSGNTLTLRKALVNNYYQSGIDKAQIIRIPEYHNLTINSGGILSVSPWDGNTGGVMYFYVNGTADVQGSIITDGLGFRGGNGGSGATEVSDSGDTGESTIGDRISGGSTSPGATPSPTVATNGAAGQGGIGKRATDAASGGGGASYGTLGTNGGTSVGGATSPAPGGVAGVIVGNQNLLQNILLGSGGGGGGKSKDPNGQGGGNGARGAGSIGFFIKNLNVGTNGLISAKGLDGQNGISDQGAGGGAGAGGAILASYETANISNPNVFNINGGTGGNAAGANSGRGGDGGNGRLMINYCKTTNGTINTASLTQAFNCGLDNFSIRWTGKITSDAGAYRFKTYSDDGIKVWVDDVLTIDKWLDGYSENFAQKTLIAGEHNIKVEYYENNLTAQAKLLVVPDANHAPVVSAIPSQNISLNEDFQTINLNNYVTDQDNDPITWTYSGNNQLSVAIAGNTATITKPANWSGEENITFIARDVYGDSSSASAKFKLIACAQGQYSAQYYYDNNSLSGQPAYTKCESNIDYDWGSEGPSGANTELIVEAGQTFYTDDARSKLNATAAAGQNIINVANFYLFQAEDEVIILQMDDPNSGKYEIQKIQSISSTSITLKNNLTNTYTVGGTSKAQIVKIPQYNNVTIRGTVTAHPWDGNSGGVVLFRAFGTTTVEANGVINANGLGFAGGAGGTEGGAQYTDTGHTGGSYISDTPLNGSTGGDCGTCISPAGPSNGGGGRGGRGSRGTDAASGGAGGSYGTLGAAGQSATVSPNQPGGAPGNTYGDANLTNLYLGSGGGGGGKGKDGYGSNGGNGGGIVMILANSLNIQGTVSSLGQNAANNGIGNAGGGGGGSGGSIIIKGKNVSTRDNALTVTGGGPSNGNAGGNGRPGGAGGEGRVHVDYCTAVTGALGANTTTSQISCAKDNFSVKWIGNINFPATKDYNFVTKSDDGIKVKIDGTDVINNWVDGYNEISQFRNVTQGIHEIEVNYYEKIGNASVKFVIVPASNQAPTVSTIPGQSIDPGATFTTFDLDNYVTDPENDAITWQISGNTNLAVNKDANNVVTITVPANWKGEETIVFTAQDVWGKTSSASAKFEVYKCIAGKFNAEYFNNKDLTGTPVSTECTDIITYDWGTGGPIALPSSEKGDGRDGDLTVASGQTSYTDNTRTNLSGSVNQGQNTITLASATGIQNGDVVAIMQMIGTGAGSYELNTVANIAGNVITLVNNTTNNYTVGGNAVVQVIRVPQYRNVTIDGTLTVHAWNGSNGGAMVFKANGDVQINGNIDVNGKGFRGGSSDSSSQGSQAGEGSTIGGFPNQTAPNGNGGGGAFQTSQGGPGGGGGGNATAGNTGGPGTWTGGPPGTGGNAEPNITTAAFAKAYLGGAGGAGGRAFSNPGARGGDAGGVVVIDAKNITVTGNIFAKGLNGSNGTFSNPPPENQWGYSGGGGAGAGGTIIIKGQNVNINTQKLNALGGTGGASGGGSANRGGDGSAGQILIGYCDTAIGTSLPAANTQQVQCNKDNYSIRWTGKVNITTAGRYKFTTKMDDGVKLFIDDVLAIDKWIDGYSENEVTKLLSVGLHNVKVEYYEKTGNAKAQLSIIAVPNNLPAVTSTAVTSVVVNTPYQYQVTATDQDNDILTYTLTQAPTGMTMTPLGLVTWTPTQTGTSNVNVQVSDGFGNTNHSYALTVNPPVANTNLYVLDGADGTVSGGLSITEGNSQLTDTIPSAGGANYDGTIHSPLTYVVSNVSGSYISGNQTKFKLNLDAPDTIGNGAQVKVSYDFNGDDTYEVAQIYNYFSTNDVINWEEYNETKGIKTTNGTFANMVNGKVKVEVWNAIGNNTQLLRTNATTAEGQQSFISIPFTNVAISQPNHAPTVSQIPGQTIIKDQTFNTINLNNYGTDQDVGDSITWSYSGNTSITVAIATNVATLTYPANWTGTENISFKATDTHAEFASSTAAFVVNVPPNNPPVVTQMPGQTINKGQTFTTINLANFGSDPDVGDSITWSYSGNINITVAINNNVATLTYPANWAGTENIVFKATDTRGGNASKTATFIVNQLPIVTQIPGQTIALTQSFATINLATFGSDPDAGDTITWSASGNTNITVAITSNVATLTYPANWTGTENIIFKATDSRTAFATSTAAFTVNTCASGQYAAQYFNNRGLSGTPVLTRCETTVNNDWGSGSPGAGVTVDNFSARWILNLNSQVAGTGTFTTTADDGVRLWVNNTLIIDNWVDQGATSRTASINLNAGNNVVKMEYYENGGGAVARLSYTIPVAPCTPGTNTFCVEYYNNRTFSGSPVYKTTEATINHDWGSGGPGNGVAVDNFAGRWQGNFNFTAGNHSFTTSADDGVRLWVDGNLLIDNWVDQGTTSRTVTPNLTAGNHLIKMEYYENGGGAVARLVWN